MKYMKKLLTGLVLLSLLSLVACGTGKEAGKSNPDESAKQETQTSPPQTTDENGGEQDAEGSAENQSSQAALSIVDLESLGIKTYKYPSKFSMGDNLKTAITELALSYEHFDQDSVNSEPWKETFVSNFIQNSRLSFDYLDSISDQNNGQISPDQLNYIQYSLTNTELDFSPDYTSVNRKDAASSLNHGQITGYNYEDTKDGVLIAADLEVGTDGTDTTREYMVTAELVQNPYSCFDGYSVVSISSKPVTSKS